MFFPPFEPFQTKPLELPEPSEFDSILQGLMGAQEIRSRDESKALLLKLADLIELPGEEISLDSLKGPDGKVKKPYHFCRECEVTFGTENTGSEIISFDKLIRFSECSLGGKPHIYHKQCVVVKVCQGLYERSETESAITWNVLPRVISQHFACNKENTKLVCKDTACWMCKQLKIVRSEGGISSSTNMDLNLLPWMTGWRTQGSVIIRPHFRKQDLPYIVDFFFPGELIDFIGYRAEGMYVKLETPVPGQVLSERQQEEDKEEEENAKEQNEIVESREWRDKVARLEMDDYSYGIIPPVAVQQLGVERYIGHPIYSMAISRENFQKQQEDTDHA